MIVRDEGETLLLITQPDHAQLAGEIVAAMRSEPALAGPGRETVLHATREHDNGWREVDAAPPVDPQTGHPYDFTTGPASIKVALWPRGIARVAQTNARAAALIAEHALTVYRYRAGDPEWSAFFDRIQAMRDDLLARSGDAATRAAFEEDYRCVGLGDLFSLHFCAGWAAPHEGLGYRTHLRETTLLISPDPFDGATVPLQVPARRIPARRYADDADLRAALTASVPAVLTGTARGLTL